MWLAHGRAAINLDFVKALNFANGRIWCNEFFPDGIPCTEEQWKTLCERLDVTIVTEEE